MFSKKFKSQVQPFDYSEKAPVRQNAPPEQDEDEDDDDDSEI